MSVISLIHACPVTQKHCSSLFFVTVISIEDFVHSLATGRVFYNAPFFENAGWVCSSPLE